MAKPIVRLRVIQFVLSAALIALVLRAAQVQLLEGHRYAAAAAAQRTERVTLDAPRGTLFDRHGTAIALTQETYHVGVAPNELRDPRRDGAVLARQLRLSPEDLDRALGRHYAWFAGPYTALDVQVLRTMRGVHLEPVLRRFYPSPDFARAVIGRVGEDGEGSGGGGGGLERLLDTILAGTPGSAVVLKDREGREYVSPARVIATPVAGYDVVLTLDAELQEIAQRALDDALEHMQADGGDVVMLDPATGEVLAVASRRADGTMRPSAFTETFEPGSIAKIFAAAALVSYDRVRPTERVFGENGQYRLPDRVVTDEHPLPSLTLADAIRVSSNIAMVKFSARLRPAEQYDMLRRFGFGTPTGIEFPAESPGRLRPPREWTRPSSASLAIGYEFAVTPIQVAAAYGAIANNGVLLQPTLIREVRTAGGKVLYSHRAEPVRRVVSAEVAAKLRDLLRGVVEAGGTAERAALANFQLAAKTGTARRVVEGRYAAGEYTASFAALFPADDPQLVLVMKIDNPQKGSYFAAQTAAPVTRSMLEQALAARTVALDRARLAKVAPAERAPLEEPDGVVPYVVPWPYAPDNGAADRVDQDRVVPNVAGRSLREAARALHQRGFHVVVKGWGVVHHTWPAAGERAAVGTTVTMFAEAPNPK